MKYISGRCPYFFKKNHAAWHHVFSILPVFLEYVLEIFWKLPLDTSVLEFLFSNEKFDFADFCFEVPHSGAADDPDDTRFVSGSINCGLAESH